MSRSISESRVDGSVIVMENDEAATVAAELRFPIDPRHPNAQPPERRAKLESQRQ